MVPPDTIEGSISVVLVNPSVLGIVQPLQSLPSILALRDVRRRMLARLGGTPNASRLASLLAVDPLTTLRAIRFANAPLLDRPEALTIPEIVASLGVTAVQRLLDVPVVEPERSSRLRTLWLHALATAEAAGQLSEERGTGFDRGYIAGLLCEVDLWLRLLGLHHNGEPSDLTVEDLTAMWQLPALPHTEPTLAGLVEKASRLATAAGYPRPNEADDSTFATDGELRERVTARLDALGVDPDDAIAPQSAGSDSDASLFPGLSQGGPSEMILSLLQCTRSSSYTGLVTVGTAAALRYLDFDRAFYVSLNQETSQLFVRAKADLSIRRFSRRPVTPTTQEYDTFLKTLADGAPRVLVRDPGGLGLCGQIATDRAVVVPVARHWTSPSFLVLDRSLTGRYLDLDDDGPNVTALAGLVAILTDNLELRVRRTRARREATIDPLTRLANRGVGLFSLEQQIARSKRQRTPLCLMMLDLDDFKKLNDTYGHLVGDRALRITADVLRKSVRRSDTVCRYGGEEFIITLPETDAEEASVLATRIFVAIAEAGESAQLPLTTSIGMSTLRHDEDDVDALIGRADRALYASKARGRNRFSVDSE